MKAAGQRGGCWEVEAFLWDKKQGNREAKKSLLAVRSSLWMWKKPSSVSLSFAVTQQAAGPAELQASRVCCSWTAFSIQHSISFNSHTSVKLHSPGSSGVAGVRSHKEPVGTGDLWSPSLQPVPPFPTPARRSGQPQ